VCEDDPVQVEKDLQSICALGIAANSKVSDKLERLTKCLAPVRLNSKLPIYGFTDTPSTTVIKSQKKTFSPFVEVTENDQTFSIRKTTAIWLLQENEWVSSDRQIRVREKQPYSNSTSKSTIESFIAPLVSTEVHIGDLCLFKCGLDWQLGRILQLSKYDSEKKKYDKPCNVQSIEISKYVGALCSWYSQNSNNVFELSESSTMEYHSLEHYICTLPESCVLQNRKNPNNVITITKPTKQFSLTTEQISITEECMKSLLSIVENPIHSGIQQKKKMESTTLASTTDTIVIPENNEHEAELTKDLWTKCGGPSLG